ncbi:MAG TPA: PBECR2 nuclease fold domain-containing protein [bacterium]|nr:PBECR2 nuclease fold domain-containing protein [bacterium]HQL61994.1 PBECR2 nuclease fold domain-containing protein [bacterium]
MKTLIDFLGRTVRLTDERLEHILEHPEMVAMESALAETLRDPHLVIRSRTDEMATLNYRYYLRTLIGGKSLCVVVECGDADAFVWTAYLTDRPKRGEILWRKP